MIVSIICSLLFYVQAFGQDFTDFYPSARALNLQRLNALANRIDKFVAVPRGFWDGSLFRGNRAMEPVSGNNEAIGVRGNFEDLPKTIDVDTRRLPLSVMEESDNGSPMAPTQWQMMVSPFVMLLPDVSEFCQCRAMANCGCCVGFFIKPLGIRNNLCLNASITKDSNSNSQYMTHLRLHYDSYKVLDVSVSETQPPMACISVVPFSTVAGCLQLVNFHKDTSEEKLCTCFATSLQFRDRPVITLPSGCFCAGKPVPNGRKRGIFGIDLGSVLGKLQDMLLG